ncbi:pimeloyl-ACP methyl ester esterase BioH [Psychromonas algicola]|uniref:pimeloyl-ACP methyl ester esterase BioH n=1 Tax=Psychromonas algicola TaxID=2555642 RepID=UPI0010674353|nr:pimeloyl-ACP methyl ester esterase BioH [Psychromonas sp. RZ5]TEW43757.1 pimeloyl-ACP methyl ester esterase BioH [Psychromonas sp. RZ5]
MSIEQLNGYQTMGSGKDLVLIHGWGVNCAVWQTIAEQLSQSYRVHLVNLPGFGGEPALPDYSLEAIAEHLLNKLPHNAVWCGWSLGGLVATYVASHFPERVDKLIQVCASLKFVEDGSWLGVKKEVFELFKVGVNKQPEKTLNRFLSLQAMGSETVKTDIANLKKLLDDQISPEPFALIAGLDLLNDVDLREEFKQLTMPSLSLFGELDTLVPVANLKMVQELSSSNQQVIFKHSSHAPFISEPKRFQQVLLDFINA